MVSMCFPFLLYICEFSYSVFGNNKIYYFNPIILLAGEAWFRSSPGDKWGYENFMPLKYLNEFVVNDTVTIEVQFLNLSVMKILPEWK